MSMLDFKEIAKANGSDGKQDDFEIFAREFFALMGFQIDEGPDRGADGGRDLIVIEKRTGFINDTNVRWLVSCKHYAHSGKSVCDRDEEDVCGRLDHFKCKGFIGFYSTLPSAGLSNKLNSYKDRYEIEVFDNSKIERILLETQGGEWLVRRFFPKSYEKEQISIGPSLIYGKYYPLKCEVCGKDLIKKGVADSYAGVVAMALDMDSFDANPIVNRYTKVYCACKGNCDRIMESKCCGHVITQWQDISDLVIPYEFLKWVVGLMNNLRTGEMEFTEEAYERLKSITLNIAQVAMRQPTIKEMERVRALMELPEGI